MTGDDWCTPGRYKIRAGFLVLELARRLPSGVLTSGRYEISLVGIGSCIKLHEQRCIWGGIIMCLDIFLCVHVYVYANKPHHSKSVAFDGF